jgi:hypothetical protein
MEIQNTSISQSNSEQNQCWIYKNTQLQTILQRHNHKNRTVFAQISDIKTSGLE